MGAAEGRHSGAVEDPAERGYRVAYDEAIRALDLQRGAFDSLRTRVGFLLSAAAIATSFLGGLALRMGSDAGTWVGIALFAAFGAVALRILWPRAESAAGFTARPSALIEGYLEDADGLQLPAMYRDLALYAEDAYDSNESRHLGPLTWWFRLGILLLTAEVIAWVINLALQ